MGARPFFVDTLGFFGDVDMPHWDDQTMHNAQDSGVRLIHMTAAWPMQDWRSTLETIRQTIKGLKEKADTFQLLLTRKDLEIIEKDDKIGIILGIQDPSFIGERLERVRHLYEEGIRIIQVAYQGRNLNGCGFVAERLDHGLTNTGREFVAAVNEAGLILDVSHLATQTALDCVNASVGPTMISHTTARDIYDHPRGSANALLKALARLPDTLVGLLTMTFFLHPADNGLTPLVRHIRHVAGIIGPDKVAIGSDGPVGGFTDLDAAERMFQEKTQRLMDPEGVLKSRWPTHIPEIFEDCRGFERIGKVLSGDFSPREIEGILGGNGRRYFGKNLPST